MKKILLSICLIVGFILTASEGDTFLPNIIGVVMCIFSANKLRLFSI